MNIFFGILIGFIVLTTLVVLHELGHFLTAKKNGVKVNEFGIGFPPRAIAWIHIPASQVEEYLENLSEAGKKQLNQTKLQKKLTKIKNSKITGKEKYYWLPFPKAEYQTPQKYLIFSLNYLPIGGFCAMDGESAADTKRGTFGATNFWQKTQILFGGVIMNWLTAIVIFTILAWTGMPEFLPNQFSIQSDAKRTIQPVIISKVLEASPAEKAGIKKNSQIISMSEQNSNQKIQPTNSQSVIDFNNSHKSQTVVYNLKDLDSQQEYTAVATLTSGENNQPALGIALESNFTESKIHYTWSASLVGIGTTAQITTKTFEGFGELIKNIFQGVVRQFSGDNQTKEEGKKQISKVGDSVSGPVGIIGVLFPAFTSAGPTDLAFLPAVISISLACMNVLPIPALDGGRWFLIGLFKLRGKKLKKQTEEKIVGRAFLALIALSLLITILDIVKITK